MRSVLILNALLFVKTMGQDQQGSSVEPAPEQKSPGKWTTMLRKAKAKDRELADEQYRKEMITPLSLSDCRRKLDMLKDYLAHDHGSDDPDLKGGTTESEFDGLYDVVSHAEDAKTICQVGFTWGASALAFLCASPPGTHLITFDMGVHPKFKQALNWINTQPPFKGRHHVIVGNTMNTLPQAATTKTSWMHDRKCDIVFHDGAHTKDVVYADIKNLRPLASPEALLLVDDCTQKYDYYDPVVSAVKQAQQDNYIGHMADKYYPTYTEGGDLDWKKSRFVCQGAFISDHQEF